MSTFTPGVAGITGSGGFSWGDFDAFGTEMAPVPPLFWDSGIVLLPGPY